ncbi:uroporphyrinogen-III synthase [Coccidioides immitis RS]|uniref:Uroporphyrinogen-III synthase n=1 Tax=Coccidioides immitis (strain RS) TaxID=246410 RepID=A0A0E1S0I7_COCIM|nr:uroporphyrinogen-III synthase [Coccidioides immitis RS]EAS36362.1 uroporphyrinogen-III synthase [Coccidioides immitis RS]
MTDDASFSTSKKPDEDSIPVLLLKTKSTPHDGYEEYFSSSTRRYSYKPIFVPVLEHVFDYQNLSKVKDLFVSGSLKWKYGGLVFTSQRAVEGFSRMIAEEVNQDIASEASRDLALYTIGPATCRSLNTLRQTHLPHATLVGEDAGTGEILAPLILEHYNGLERNQITYGSAEAVQDRSGKLPLLFLVGETHRDIIPKSLMSPDLPPNERIQIDELIVYKTGVMESFRENFASILDELDASVRSTEGATNPDEGNQMSRSPIWVVVFSPTGCDAMVDILGKHDQSTLKASGMSQTYTKKHQQRRNCYIATIGPTTRDHLRFNFGIDPDVCAEKPSPEGVGEGIESVLVKRS